MGLEEVKVINILSTLQIDQPLLKTYDIVVQSVKWKYETIVKYFRES